MGLSGRVVLQALLFQPRCLCCLDFLLSSTLHPKPGLLTQLSPYSHHFPASCRKSTGIPSDSLLPGLGFLISTLGTVVPQLAQALSLGLSDPVVSSVGKESACNEGDPSSIPGSGRSAGEGTGYPFQSSWASLMAQLVKNPPAVRET